MNDLVHGRALQDVIHRRAGLGLDPGDAHVISTVARTCQQDPRHQTAAAHGHHDVFDLGSLGEHLREDCGLARDDARVVEGRDVADRTLVSEFEGVGLGLVVGRSELDEFDVVIAQLLDLGGRRVGRYDHCGGHVQDARGVRDAESVITGRGGDDRAVGIVAVRRVDRGEGATNLERSRYLQVLEFGEHRTTAQAQRDRRGRFEMVGNDPCGRFELGGGGRFDVTHHPVNTIRGAHERLTTSQ